MEGDASFAFLAAVVPPGVRTSTRRLGRAELDYVVLLPSADQCVERIRTRLGHVIEIVSLDAEATVDEVMQRRATGQLRIRSVDL